MISSWEDLAEKKRHRLASLIPESWRIPADQLPDPSERNMVTFMEKCGLFTSEEYMITHLTLEQLAQRIATGNLTAIQVCRAYCHRAAIAHQLVNCLIEINFEDAMEQAKQLDEFYQTHGKTIGSLHGIPISLKDQFRVKGLESSIGYVARLENVDDHDSVLTECLRRAGAIVYVKTSVPQTLMIGETISNILGRTTNPYNRLLSCGGSSGGEGALIALHGSPIGIGTDVGGSIRIPAAFNGLFGLKSSHGRFPVAKVAKSLEGSESIRSIGGPIAHSSQDIAYFMKVILSEKPWNYDPDVIDLPWRDERYDDGRLGFKTFAVIATDGIFGFDGQVMPHPPILRGIRIVIDALRQAGHDVVQWKPYKHVQGLNLVNEIFSADGKVTSRAHMGTSGEPPVDMLKSSYQSASTRMDLNQLWKLQSERTDYQREYLNVWQQQYPMVDAWILPVAPHAAIEHDKYKYYGYSTLINLLDWPAITIPVTYADKKLDLKDVEYKAVNDLDSIINEEYDADVYHGAPVAVQLVGRRLQEEYLVGLATLIDQVLKSSTEIS